MLTAVLELGKELRPLAQTGVKDLVVTLGEAVLGELLMVDDGLHSCGSKLVQAPGEARARVLNGEPCACANW